MSGQATTEAGVRNADLAQHTLPAGPGPDATVGAARVVPFPTERPEAADPEAGVLVADRYRLVELVGRGVTAQVWRARDELLGRDVAVKQVERSQPYALVEARLAARVRHPHVGVVHDVVVHEGSDWLVMDYHPGASLAAVLGDSKRLSPAAVAALGLQLLAALRAVHEAGVVHCDVKPANWWPTVTGLSSWWAAVRPRRSGEPATNSWTATSLSSRSTVRTRTPWPRHGSLRGCGTRTSVSCTTWWCTRARTGW